MAAVRGRAGIQLPPTNNEIRQAMTPPSNGTRLGDMSMRRELMIRALSRASVAGRLGQSYDDDRDLYEALGYDKNPTFKDYMARYERQDIARALIDKPVRNCWRKRPSVSEGEDEPTPFVESWEALERRLNLFHYMVRLDRLASIGRWAVLYLGFDDPASAEPRNPVERANDLLFVMPYSEDNAQIKTTVKDKEDPRYGKPESYTITFVDGGGAEVHHSRIIHVAEDMLENDWEGTPRLKSVLNRLEDLARVSGGSAEMFWRGAFPGYGFTVDPDASITAQDLDDLQDEIEDYMHGLKRYLRLRGMKIDSLKPQVADPSKHIDVILDLVAAASGIPKRILLGSERGELASSQDERAFVERTVERQKEHCEAIILRPLIDRCIQVGVLDPPREWSPEEGMSGYDVVWPDLMLPSEKEVADVAKVVADTANVYLSSGMADIIPPDVWLRDIQKLDEATLDKIEEQLQLVEESRKQDEEDIRGGGGTEDDEEDEFDDEDDAA